MASQVRSGNGAERGVQASRGDAPLLTGVEPAPRFTRGEFLLITGLIVAAFALRLPGLDHGLWLDEILTLVEFVRLPAAEIITRAGALNNHVLYSLSAHFSVTWLGESAWTLRLPALIFGVATLPAVYYLGRQISCRNEAFLATLFLALSYHHVWFSQNARGYTGLLLGAVVATVLFIRLLAAHKPSGWLITAYVIVVTLATWLHLTFVMVLLAHALVWLALALTAARQGRAGAAVPSLLALLAAAFLTLVTNILNLMTTVSQAGDSAIWHLDGAVQGLGQAMPGGWVFLLLAAAAVLAGLISLARRSPAVAGLLTLPIIIGLAVIELTSLNFFPRFLFSSAAFVVLLGVRGGFALARPILPGLQPRGVLFIGFAIALAGSSSIPAAWRPKQDFAAAAEFLAEQRAPGDAVVCLGGTVRYPLVRYMGMECELAETAEQLDDVEQGHRRTWLVYTLPGFTSVRMPELWHRVQAPEAYEKVRVFRGTLYGGDITVLLKRTSQGSEAHERP